MTEAGRNIRNSMSGHMQWPAGSLIPQGLAVAHGDSLITQAAVLGQPWTPQHLFAAAQGRSTSSASNIPGVVINTSQHTPYRGGLAMLHPHPTNGVGPSNTQPMGGVSLSGHQGAKQYDAQKQFGSLPQQNTKRNKISITSKTNLYISGLSEGDNDESVRALVREVVVPKSCKAMMTDGKCRGSGFIDCETEEDAEKAMQHILDTTKGSKRKLSVKFANENEKDTQNVYVRNLPKTSFTVDNLQALFNAYGEVTSVKLLESSGIYTGTGFVRFNTPEQAQTAVDAVNREKKILPECDKPVTCKLADKTDPRRKARLSPLADNGQSPVGGASQAAGNGASGNGLMTGAPQQTLQHTLPHSNHGNSNQHRSLPNHQQSNHGQQPQTGSHVTPQLGLVQAATPNGYLPQTAGIMSSQTGHTSGSISQRNNANGHPAQPAHQQAPAISHMTLPLQHPYIIASMQNMTLNGANPAAAFNPHAPQQVTPAAPNCVYGSPTPTNSHQQAPQGYYPVSYAHPQAIAPHQPSMTPPNPATASGTLNGATGPAPQPGIVYPGQPGPHLIYAYPTAPGGQHPTAQPFSMHFYAAPTATQQPMAHPHSNQQQSFST